MDNTIGVVEEGNNLECLRSKVKQEQLKRVHAADNSNNNVRLSDHYDILVRLYLQYAAIPNPKSLLKINWKVNSQFTCHLKRVPLITTANHYPSNHPFMTAECDSNFHRVSHPPASIVGLDRF